MKSLLHIFLLFAVTVKAETLFVFKGTNGYEVAATHSEFSSFDLGTPYRGGEHPDVARWKQDIRLPFPSVWPCLIDRGTGATVPVVSNNVSNAAAKLSAVVDLVTPDSVKIARRKSKELLGTNTVEQLISAIETGTPAQKSKAIEDSVKLFLLQRAERPQN